MITLILALIEAKHHINFQGLYINAFTFDALLIGWFIYLSVANV